MKRLIFKLSSLALISVLILMSLSSCKTSEKTSEVIDNINRAVEQNNKKDTSQTIKSTDGLVQVTAPGDYTVQKNLSEDANIQIANLLQEKYFIVISEPKTDFPAGFTIDDYYDLLSGNFKKELEKAALLPPVNIKVGNYNAKQFEVSGVVNKLDVKYAITVVETEKNFHQVQVWTLKDNFDKTRDEFQGILTSLKEVSK